MSARDVKLLYKEDMREGTNGPRWTGSAGCFGTNLKETSFRREGVDTTVVFRSCEIHFE